MKILHYIPTYAPAWIWGGPVVSTSRLCAGLQALGHDVTVFTTNAGLDESYASKVTIQEGVRVVYARSKHVFAIRSPEIEAMVRREITAYDIVHVTGIWQPISYAACDAATKVGMPYVLSPRGALGPYSWQQKRLKKILYYLLRERSNVDGAAGIHFTSCQEARECARFLRNQASAIIPNGVIEKNVLQPGVGETVAWRSHLQLPGGTKIFLYAGRFHHKKGLDLLPGVLAPLRNENWTLLLIGDDEDRTRTPLELAFQKQGLGAKIRFLPRLAPPELRRAYASADLLLFPSLHENFGNIVVEALHAGCPVVASDQVGAAEDAAASGGVLRLAREPALWTQAVQDVLLARWPAASREYLSRWTTARYSDVEVAQSMANFYSEILAQHERHS